MCVYLLAMKIMNVHKYRLFNERIDLFLFYYDIHALLNIFWDDYSLAKLPTKNLFAKVLFTNVITSIFITILFVGNTSYFRYYMYNGNFIIISSKRIS